LKVGIVFPTTEIGEDLDTVVRFAKDAEAAGYRYLLAFDHVLGADTDSRPDWDGFYSAKNPFHEPLILFAYLAAITELEFITGVMILPQRQTVLVAKQVAELDLVSRGRLRLGVGIGWNPLEYEGLGIEFEHRTARFEEQIELLRQLWTKPIVDFDGRFHRVDRAGILPLPVQRPVPIWVGTMGTSKGALRRIGKLADGWMPHRQPGDELAVARSFVREGAESVGRDPSSIKLEGRIRIPREVDADAIRRLLDAWAGEGAEYVAIDTLHVGLTPEQHRDRALEIAEIAGLGQGMEHFPA
jgi:probable F420-dependent oxidoreductase